MGANPANVDAYQCDSTGTCQLPGGTHGVRVFGDASDRWVGTRPVWNEFSYHVTDFELSAGHWNVPMFESPSWLHENNYRQNVQGGALFPVPDLWIEFETFALCPTTIRLSALVHNDGSLGVFPGVPVAFYRTDDNIDEPPQLLGTLETETTMLPGGSERLVFDYELTTVGEEMTFSATVDPDDAIEECDEHNNQTEDRAAFCPGGPD